MKTKFIVYAEIECCGSRISDAAVRIAETKVLDIAHKIKENFMGERIFHNAEPHFIRDIFIAEVRDNEA